MDRLILEEKLESLRRCVARIDSRRADTAEALAQDVDRQDILALNLSRAVQLCVDMAVHVLAGSPRAAPHTMGESFELLAEEGLIDEALADRMRAAVGFRNVAVHSYRSIDWSIVHTITHEGMADFRDFAARMASLLGD